MFWHCHSATITASFTPRIQSSFKFIERIWLKFYFLFDLGPFLREHLIVTNFGTYSSASGYRPWRSLWLRHTNLCALVVLNVTCFVTRLTNLCPTPHSKLSGRTLASLLSPVCRTAGKGAKEFDLETQRKDATMGSTGAAEPAALISRFTILSYKKKEICLYYVHYVEVVISFKLRYLNTFQKSIKNVAYNSRRNFLPNSWYLREFRMERQYVDIKICWHAEKICWQRDWMLLTYWWRDWMLLNYSLRLQIFQSFL